MQEAATEFLNIQQNQNRIKNLIGRGNRLTVDIDEVRNFNSTLSDYIKQNPLQAIKMFEDQLNQ